MNVRNSTLTVTLLLAVGAAPVFADDEELAARVAKLERALESRGLVDLLQQVERLQRETQELRGQLEEQQYTIDRLRQSQRDGYSDLERRLSRQGTATEEPALEGEPPLAVYEPSVRGDVAGQPAPEIDVQVQRPGRVPTEVRTPDDVVTPGREDQPIRTSPGDAALRADEYAIGIDPDTRTAPRVAVAPERPSVGPEPALNEQGAEEAYRNAFSLLKAGQYDQSIDAFNAFLLDYPTSEYADNAQYWLGETYFVKQDYGSAIAEYRKLISNYPQSKKQSHAMLKVGYSYHKMGEPGKAQAVLEDLRGRFPGTTAARLASERIQQILAENNP